MCEPRSARIAGACVLALATLASGQLPAQPAPFRRGDVNSDGIMDLSDPIRLLELLFRTRSPLPCEDAADANDDGTLDLSDGIYALSFLFLGTAPPRPPFPVCGPDATQDALTCESYGAGDLSASCSEEDIEAAVILLTNQERAAAGSPPLRHNPLLGLAIGRHCRDMAENDYFGHVSLDGRTLVDRIQDAGYLGLIYGENIAAGYETPIAAVQGWLGSDLHRATLLSRSFREIGVGHAYDAASKHKTYWGQDFGMRTDVYPVVINLEAPSTISRSVRLYVYGSGVASEMQVANDSSFTDAAWRPHRADLSWLLAAGGGIKTVYVKLRTGAMVFESQDSILLEE